MKEQDNTTLIQNIYAAFGRGDVQAILDRLSPDVEWYSEGPAVIPYAGTRYGPGEVVKFFEALAVTQEEQKLTITDYIAQGNQVATMGRYSARVKATGKQIDGIVGHYFTIEDGKITRCVSLLDTAQVADAYVTALGTAR